ncbi:MAG TPA: iron-sulfur cluster assembly accessory protein [Actinomycetota bacterium]|nr:iron-sulfur cluster assembly accessory protein [Actinomycetota bacterium]
MSTPTTSEVLQVSDAAARKIADLAHGDGRDEAVLRVRVTAGGCSGFSYRLGFEDAPAADDHVIDAAAGVRVVVDPASAPIVQGSTLDLDRNLLGGGLKMRNPQAIHECACGESFSV